ncbi:beta-lactamase [Francisella halioticida]|uniref:beta-lactamase n=1 Tax=Francisella halioticida TaxID=549298 RepID=A0ABN5B2D7_9GAMM|nr:class A beta-lactamase [Francisella halioticida]ASG68140.1 class A beta-lactamase [Francisella halioticida]BCD90914.1 beta-lactamase [Francisella halioticida]
MNKIIFSLLTLLIVNLAFATSNRNINISNNIHKIESHYGGKVGVYTINRNNGQNFSHNETFYFPICSIYKFLVVGAILKESMADSNLLDEKIRISGNQIVGYSPITKKHIGKEITVRQLCKASILSDNTATNLLIDKLGGLKKLSTFILSLKDHATKITALEPKINDISLNNNLNKTTPKIIVRDLNKIAFSKNILDKKHRTLFKKWLEENNTGSNRIAAELPKDWKIGDKTGTCDYGSTNDVAIIWPNNDKAIIMAIFYTQPNKNAKPNNKVIREVAKILFDNFNSKKNA